MSTSERQRLIELVAEAECEARRTVPPKPLVTLPTPPGWSKTKRRPLPPAFHGFTVAYEHESGLSVTLYQFTQGHACIPRSAKSPLVVAEMQRAKNGIEQAVQLGYWETAQEVDSQTVFLGDSQQQALWAGYHLTVDGVVLASDIYVWAQANAIFKIRCTSRSDLASNRVVLGPFLTSLGSSVTVQEDAVQEDAVQEDAVQEGN